MYNYTQYFFLAHRLPIDGPSGEPLYAEAAVAGKKKDAVLECALEACRMLDASGLLRQSSHGNYMEWFLILIISVFSDSRGVNSVILVRLPVLQCRLLN